MLSGVWSFSGARPTWATCHCGCSSRAGHAVTLTNVGRTRSGGREAGQAGHQALAWNSRQLGGRRGLVWFWRTDLGGGGRSW